MQSAARSLAKRSIREYDLGQLEAALHDVEVAYLLAPRPEMLFNVGQCHRALEHWKEAARSFRNYLRYRPNASNRAGVERLIAEMDEKAERADVLPQPAPAPTAPPPRHLPPPQPPVAAAVPVVEAPPAATAAAQATETAPAEGHSHALSIALGVGGLASAGVAIWGLAQVLNFQSLQGQSQGHPGTVPVAQAISAQSSAQTGQIVAIAGAIVAAGLGVGAGFTW